MVDKSIDNGGQIIMICGDLTRIQKTYVQASLVSHTISKFKKKLHDKHRNQKSFTIQKIFKK